MVLTNRTDGRDEKFLRIKLYWTRIGGRTEERSIFFYINLWDLGTGGRRGLF